tara:strand:- start:101 stop:385 length:285 start_codon:yes stop_codon:yes gene_type:complete
MSDTDNDELWGWCYGKNKKQNEDEYDEFHLIMAGGGDHWWNYVVRPNNIYILSKSGYEKIDGILVQSDCGNYLAVKENELCLHEDECIIEYDYL